MGIKTALTPYSGAILCDISAIKSLSFRSLHALEHANLEATTESRRPTCGVKVSAFSRNEKCFPNSINPELKSRAQGVQSLTFYLHQN